MRLKAAAESLRDVDVAFEAGDAVFAPPSAWLVRPAGGAETGGGRYRFRVLTRPGLDFVTGVRPARGGETGDAPADTYEADIGALDDAAFSGFGDLRRHHLAEPHVDAAIARVTNASEDAIVEWLSTSVSAITQYFGKVPDDRVTMLVAPGTSEAMRGVTLAGGGASVLLRIGTAFDSGKLRDDWVAAHELVHVAFPSIDYRSTWFSEGLASYVEPVARARLGVLSPEKVWSDLVDGVPQGLPGPRDAGLDGTREWGRVYWGGALFCLLADVEIRERTGGARSLEDAVRAIASVGNDVEVYWPMERVLEVGDHATGTQVLHELYARLALAPGTEDLVALWRRLGVVREGKTTRFDESAPLARYRAAITTPRTATRDLSQDLSRP
jgi:predicted metalloprotease with PDZ domain